MCVGSSAWRLTHQIKRHSKQQMCSWRRKAGVERRISMDSSTPAYRGGGGGGALQQDCFSAEEAAFHPQQRLVLQLKQPEFFVGRAFSPYFSHAVEFLPSGRLLLLPLLSFSLLMRAIIFFQSLTRFKLTINQGASLKRHVTFSFMELLRLMDFRV